MYILTFSKKANVHYCQAAGADPLVPIPTAPTQAPKPLQGSAQLPPGG